MSSPTIPWLIAGLLLAASGPAFALGDPTRPPAGQEGASAGESPGTSSGAPRVSSILHGETSRARINGVWLRAGEEHAGLRVIRIERRRVIVRDDGERRELSLQGRTAIKRPVDDKEHP
ncbi:MSHA biogenesis protein MshK [Thiohalospira halophila DSM 15071]|uniref:MSHA biogenesis protein MshK n=1 Tax=Thiohalospira halophila DSM 15071 TaxID=1123397 RepID=A0A1I1N7J4_9GAMM|nr:hypothetical protein [Thiohalospira halophila]SFC93651.1 MSHA biogenesis protein MshK [Thiohalospira halophila DSM 15071]